MVCSEDSPRLSTAALLLVQNTLYTGFSWVVIRVCHGRSQAVTGRVTAEIPRQYIITDLHLHAVRQREKEQRRAKNTIKQGTLSQSCKMEREMEDTCHQQRRRLQRKVYIRNRERRRDEREEKREKHEANSKTRRSFPQGTEGKDRRETPVTNKEGDNRGRYTPVTNKTKT